MEALSVIGNYLFSVIIEGLTLGFLFWAITYVTVESTSLSGAVKAGLVAEIVGNLPYLAGLPATSAPGVLTGFVSAILFCWLITRVGELTFGKAIYGVATTYFVLIAIVSCS
ncbi:MAG: hypothetical protein AAF541_15090 [Pseudomonadota bacterium]